MKYFFITLAKGEKQHVSVFSASAPSHFTSSHLRTAAKIEAAINTSCGDLVGG
jgi:hypothetical protein